MDALARLAADLVATDSRSFVSNLPLAARLMAELGDFETEALDYTDPAGTAKRVLIAHRGGPGGLALSGHMDTVPDTGWTDDPFSGRIDADGMLHGLGSADMKGPIAAAIVAARALPASVPITLLLTTDEETTKQGAREIVARSALVRRAAPRAIAVVEPTRLIPLRGHRSSIGFTCTAEGVQAHSSTGEGRNANWTLIPFLAEMREVFARVRDDPALRDPAYDPPFGDFNLVIDNHGAAVNVTVPLATARIKFRYSARIDPEPIRAAVHEAAARAGVTVREAREGRPPELPEDHPLIRLAARVTGTDARTAAFGTDASELSALAPCVVLGPGDIAVAHRPGEAVALAELARGVAVFARLAEAVAAG